MLIPTKQSPDLVHGNLFQHIVVQVFEIDVQRNNIVAVKIIFEKVG